ncbi:putative pectate lyase 3, partial [Mucuna pruriens]
MVNPKPRTLHFAIVQQGPLWIVFERNMVIELRQELLISSKTIDGCGTNVQIKNGDGLTMQYNVIIHGICIKKIMPKDGGMIRDSYNHFGLRTRSDSDAISLLGVSNIWIDHVSLSNFINNVIDIIKGSTTVAISNCHMTKHNDPKLRKPTKFLSTPISQPVKVSLMNSISMFIQHGKIAQLQGGRDVGNDREEFD